MLTELNTMKTTTRYKKKGPKKTAQQIITDQMIALIEERKVGPWQKEWCANGVTLAGPNSPRNHVSPTVYKGVNVFTLAGRGFSSPYWLTFKQLAKLGGNVKGEKGTKILFFNWLLKDANDNVTKNPEEAVKKIPVWTHNTVFNQEQISGVTFPEIPAQASDKPQHEKIAAAEALLDGYKDGPSTVFGGDRACYWPDKDRVNVPRFEDFTSPEAAYATRLHEEIHGTGHTSRLNRPEVMTPTSYGTDMYSREELVAELGASYLSSITGCWTDKVKLNSAAYLHHWLEALKADPKLLITAGSQANKAAEYIAGCPLDEWQAPAAS